MLRAHGDVNFSIQSINGVVEHLLWWAAISSRYTGSNPVRLKGTDEGEKYRLSIHGQANRFVEWLSAGFWPCYWDWSQIYSLLIAYLDNTNSQGTWATWGANIMITIDIIFNDIKTSYSDGQKTVFWIILSSQHIPKSPRPHVDEKDIALWIWKVSGIVSAKSSP